MKTNTIKNQPRSFNNCLAVARENRGTRCGGAGSGSDSDSDSVSVSDGGS